ncbi:MAG TPA: hypothetical protein VGB17_18770 [Pyrinomonadaceae bacterium]|jgi:hypothetical protein
MAVVIDEFEVVAEEGESGPSPGTPAATSNAAASPTVHDIERVAEHLLERFERIWAS